MEFEWDEAKDAANRAKHGIGFARVMEIDWDLAIVLPDDRYDYGEERSLAFGRINDRLYACVFVLRNGKRRIISLRKANPREERTYAP